MCILLNYEAEPGKHFFFFLKVGAFHMVEREEHSDDKQRDVAAPLDLRHLIPASPQKPWVELTVGNELIGGNF